MATVESVLRDVQELSPDERQRLLELLTPQPLDVPEEILRIRERIAHRRPSTPEERATTLATLDQVAAQVRSAWKSNMSALEAVQEQRRDL